MCNFDKTDVIKMAWSIIEDPLTYMDGDFTPYYMCDFCRAELTGYHVDEDDFKHSLNCPVLIAQDVLTGNNRTGEDR